MTFDQYLVHFHSQLFSDPGTAPSLAERQQILLQSIQTGNQLAAHVGLTFVIGDEDGNVCFANQQDEMRDEYKQAFAPLDLWDYVYAVLHSSIDHRKFNAVRKGEFSDLPYPKDAAAFWQLVKIGKELRKAP